MMESLRPERWWWKVWRFFRYRPYLLQFAALITLVILALRRPDARIWSGAVFGYLLCNLVETVIREIKRLEYHSRGDRRY